MILWPCYQDVAIILPTIQAPAVYVLHGAEDSTLQTMGRAPNLAYPLHHYIPTKKSGPILQPPAQTRRNRIVVQVKANTLNLRDGKKFLPDLDLWLSQPANLALL